MFPLGIAVAQRLAPFGVARFLYCDVHKKSESGMTRIVYIGFVINKESCMMYAYIKLVNNIMKIFRQLPKTYRSGTAQLISKLRKQS